MFHSITLLEKIIPKEMETLERRYEILRAIQRMQPVGRRGIASSLNIGEKIVRSDTDFFREEQYVEVTTSGMLLTENGINLLEQLNDMMNEVEGIRYLEEQLRDILGCQDITIVSGNADVEPEAMNNIGRSAAKILQSMINDGSIVALTGGHTMRSVVQQVKPVLQSSLNAMIVPARGSLGNNVETQANTLVELLAKKLKCDYKLLNLPDNLSQAVIESVSQDPNIRKVIEKIRQANVIVFGIGNAKKMAYRRDLNAKVLAILSERKAVAEALGYYFNKEGDMVYDSRTIGFHLEEFENNIHPIAVAGGESKALAILSVRYFIRNGSLVIDEACANKVIELAGQEL